MIGNKKEEGNVSIVILHIIRKSSTPSKNRLIAILNRKKLKYATGFKPGLPRQNAITLPLVLPPLPESHIYYYKQIFNLIQSLNSTHSYK